MDAEAAPRRLALLMEAYAVIDAGVQEALAAFVRTSKSALACRAGCHECCLQPDIPLYPYEAEGIAWYVRERLAPEVRERIIGRIRTHRAIEGAEARRASALGCVFLLEGKCSVHPVRPIGCRLFNVVGTPCAPGEDPYYTRRHEVLDAPLEARQKAIFIMLPFYGIKDDVERYYAIEDGWIDRKAVNMREYLWKELGD